MDKYKKIYSGLVLGCLMLGIVSHSRSEAAEIEYIAHASFRITSDAGTQIIIDPYASQIWIGYDFPRNLEADALVITHPHYDHDGGQYRNAKMAWDELPKVFQYIGEYQFRDIKLKGVPGKHAGPYGKEFGQKNIIWIIEVDGIRLAHLGDNGAITDQIKAAIGTIDILMLPADGDQHILTNEEALEFIEALKPQVQIPMHYCIKELQPDGKCPGGLLPVSGPAQAGITVKELKSSSIGISAGTLPDDPEYWIFKPSALIERQSN